MKRNRGVVWVMLREARIRSRHPMSGLGLAQALLWLLVPLGLVLWSRDCAAWTRSLRIIVAFAPCTLRLAWLATGLAAEAVARDRARLGRLSVSATSYFIGKWLGSLMPLGVETVALVPFVVLYWRTLTVPPGAGLPVVAFLLASVLAWGAWGSLWGAYGATPRIAGRSAGASLVGLWILLPLAAWHLAEGVEGTPPSALLRPLLPLHPIGGLLVAGDFVGAAPAPPGAELVAPALLGSVVLLAWLGVATAGRGEGASPARPPGRDAPAGPAPAGTPGRDAPAGPAPAGTPGRDAPAGPAPAGTPGRDAPAGPAPAGTPGPPPDSTRPPGSPAALDAGILRRPPRRPSLLRSIVMPRPSSPPHLAVAATGLVLAVAALLWLSGAIGRRNLVECRRNLYAIGTAAEMYTLVDGRFPPELARLTPSHLKEIPTCPAAGIDTYQGGYAAISNPDRFTVCCSGRHHGDAGQGENQPQYTSGQGLVLP